MSDSEDDAPFDTPLDYKDKRAALIASGIILALIGCLIGLMSGLYIFLFGYSDMLSMPAPGPSGASEPLVAKKMMNILVGAGVVYGIAALIFLVVGAGNIFLKRWSRPLALILSGTWIYTGIIGLAWLMISMTKMKEFMFEEMSRDGMPTSAPPPDAYFGIMMAAQIAIFFIFGIMLPALIFWLNYSQDARTTLGVCDRKTRWTDHCPTPVLGIAVVAAFSAVMIASTAFWMPFLPVFGEMFTGGKARLLMLAVAAVLLFIGWGTYRKQLAAWALALVLVIGGTISYAVSFADYDWKEFYEMIGIPIPEDEVEELDRMMSTMYPGKSMMIVSVLAALPIVAYLVWALRFFRREPEDAESDSAPAAA